VDGEAEPLERAQKALQPVGEQDRGCGVGEENVPMMRSRMRKSIKIAARMPSRLTESFQTVKIGSPGV
jgi:hypothetical protein